MALARHITGSMRAGRKAVPRLWPVILVLGAFAAGSPARGEEGLLDWIVQSISVDEEGAAIRAALSTPPAGSTLAQGQRISTGPGQQMVLTNGRDLVTLSPGTSVEIGDNDSKTPEANLDLISGTVHVEAGKRTPGHTFSIEAPYLVATVKGTQFDVSTFGEMSAVSVTEGVVGVDAIATRQGVDVLPGKTAVVSRRALDRPSLMDTPAGGAAGVVGIDMDMASGDLDGAVGGTGTAALGSGGNANGGQGGSSGGSSGGSDSGGSDGSAGGSSDSGSSDGGSSDSGSTGGSLGGAVGDTAEAVGGAVSDTSEALGGAVSDTTGALGDAVGGPLGDTVNDVGDAVGGAVSGVGGAVGGTVDSLGGALGGALGGRK